MSTFMRSFYSRAALIFISLISVCCISFAGSARNQNEQPAVVNNDVQKEPAFRFENSIKNVFNARKNAVVRVVCVAKSSQQQVDTNSKQVLAGTGFFVTDKAHVLTAASIVKSAQMIWVDYMGASYSAECIGIDTQTNVAVLKLLQSPSNFGVVDISQDNFQRNITDIGDFVVFVGCKLGMDPLPELGNISGRNISYSENAFLTTYLRTNLAFCGGESGAPVFELNGELSGMMIASLPEMSSSFVLPKRALCKIFNEIVKNGFASHKKIGIDVQSEYKFGVGQKIVISKIVTGSTAESDGLLVGDILRKIESFPIKYKEDFYNAIFFCESSDVVDIVVNRDGSELTLKVKLEQNVE